MRAEHDFAGRKILIVDDDKAVIRVLRDGLRAARYVFAEAHDGRSALAMVRDFRPDVVVMDVEMPGLGGIQVARILRANQGEVGSAGFGYVPIILMTARGIAGKIEGLELGADDFLTKPVDHLELAARVKSMLRLKTLQEQLLGKMAELDRANQDLLEKKKDLELLSRTDGLTSLLNRRYFEERFVGEFERSKRYRSALACSMIDLDHFKRLNDTYGHPFGDVVLRGTAEVLRDTLRDVDLVGRYGGEEFIAILPETGPAESRLVGDRLRQRIAARRYATPEGEEVTVTASVGIACYPVAGVETHEDFLRLADDALYRAKESGRNRVCMAED